MDQTPVKGLGGGLFDVHRGVEVWTPDFEMDHLSPLGLQTGGLFKYPPDTGKGDLRHPSGD